MHFLARTGSYPDASVPLRNWVIVKCPEPHWKIVLIPSEQLTLVEHIHVGLPEYLLDLLFASGHLAIGDIVFLLRVLVYIFEDNEQGAAATDAFMFPGAV